MLTLERALSQAKESGLHYNNISPVIPEGSGGGGGKQVI
jgi:hypothetical protein